MQCALVNGEHHMYDGGHYGLFTGCDGKPLEDFELGNDMISLRYKRSRLGNCVK